jgi:hypothetical protein
MDTSSIPSTNMGIEHAIIKIDVDLFLIVEVHTWVSFKGFSSGMCI